MARVAIVSGLGFLEYDAFLGRFHRDYPRIELECQEMRSADVVRSLELRTATLGLSPKRALPKKIEHRLFLRQRYALFCGQYHPLFGNADVQIADLAGQKFVSFTGDKIGDPLSMLTFFRDEMGLTEPVVGSSSSMREVRRLIVAGFGIGCLPEHVARTMWSRAACSACRPKAAWPMSTCTCCGWPTASSARRRRRFWKRCTVLLMCAIRKLFGNCLRQNLNTACLALAHKECSFQHSVLGEIRYSLLPPVLGRTDSPNRPIFFSLRANDPICLVTLDSSGD